ncbi:hypothetical protein M8W91_002793 [Salmonella enterica]|nr:hypothetical protein [Salmonella enterica]EJF5856668.1 hypothetical protein [Salmonella enterica]EJF5948033.1 hypothetical protein [Salmonella enterica]EJF6158018.1 hypothetical protein [Salmonella enterica]EJF6377298.1 hypothetical protein [Salmonella enterica]
MTKTVNPVITITVSGPTGSGKSRVLAVIEAALKNTPYGRECIVDAPDVRAEEKMCGDDPTRWHSPRNGTIFKLEEINQPINTGRYSTHDVETVIEKLTTARENLVKGEAEIRNKAQAAITSADLYDRAVPVHIQALMSKLGISFEEYQETDLQPVVDLVNWALCTPIMPQTGNEAEKPDPEARLAEEVKSLAEALEYFSRSTQRISNELPDNSHFGKSVTLLLSLGSLQLANALLKNGDKPLLRDDGVEHLRELGLGLDDFIREIELDGRKFLAIALVDSAA